MSLLSRLGDLLDDRTGYKKLLARALDEPIRGGARWAYVFGSALAGAILVQAVTGLALMTSYAPSEKTAWASVHYISFVQAGGWLVRGVHHFGAQAIVVLLGAHALQVAAFGAYKGPREVTWWSGLALLWLTMGSALTGYLLPWDQKGYWATRVATNIAGTVPVVGGATQRLLQGGPDYGSLTLTRFYALHVGALPALLVLLLAAHVAIFRRHGATPPAGADLRRSDAFFPKQLGRDVAFALGVVLVVLAVAWRARGAPLDAPADASSDYPARPEWYFLALFQLLKYFHGPLEVVGTVVVPAVVGAYLFALPLLDRGSRTAVRERLRPLAPLAAIALGVGALTLLAVRDDARDADFQKERAKADGRARAASRIAKDGVPPEGPLAMLARAPEVRGPDLFDRHCGSCHVLGGHGVEKERNAPKLDAWSTEAWLVDVLHDPDGDARFGRSAYKGEMPSVDVPPKDKRDFKPMTDHDKRAAAAFLASQGDEPGDRVSRDPAQLDEGRAIVTERCTTCHLWKGEGDDAEQGLAPELSGYGSHAWVRAQIANPATKATYREQALDPDRKHHMPRFDGDLRPEDLDLLARWVRAQARGLP